MLSGRLPLGNRRALRTGPEWPAPSGGLTSCLSLNGIVPNPNPNTKRFEDNSTSFGSKGEFVSQTPATVKAASGSTGHLETDGIANCIGNTNARNKLKKLNKDQAQPLAERNVRKYLCRFGMPAAMGQKAS